MDADARANNIDNCSRVSLAAATQVVALTVEDRGNIDKILQKVRRACQGVNLRELGGNCAQTARDLDQYIECLANLAFSGGASLSAGVSCGPLATFVCCEYSCTNTRTGLAVGTVRRCRTPAVCPNPNTYSNCTCTLLGLVAGPPCDPHTCNTVGTQCN